jgi:hypothetical protein
MISMTASMLVPVQAQENSGVIRSQILAKTTTTNTHTTFNNNSSTTTTANNSSNQRQQVTNHHHQQHQQQPESIRHIEKEEEDGIRGGENGTGGSFSGVSSSTLASMSPYHTPRAFPRLQKQHHLRRYRQCIQIIIRLTLSTMYAINTTLYRHYALSTL